MRICDRCKEKAMDTITFGIEDQTFDVCDTCRKEILEAVITPKKPKRNLLSLKNKA